MLEEGQAQAAPAEAVQPSSRRLRTRMKREGAARNASLRVLTNHGARMLRARDTRVASWRRARHVARNDLVHARALRSYMRVYRKYCAVLRCPSVPTRACVFLAARPFCTCAATAAPPSPLAWKTTNLALTR